MVDGQFNKDLFVMSFYFLSKTKQLRPTNLKILRIPGKGLMINKSGKVGFIPHDIIIVPVCDLQVFKTVAALVESLPQVHAALNTKKG